MAKLEAEMAAKQARQEEKEQRGVRDVQRAWLRALWIPRCLHELLACVPRGKGRRAAATAIQRKWRRHYLRKLTKKHTGFMNAVLGVAWFLKLQVRSKRRANSANAARRFVQCYITRAVLFRITVQTFRKRVLTGQRLARSWLACQAARRAVLCRLWKRIGMRKIEQIIAKRGTERRRSLDRSKQDQDAQDAAAVARRRGAKEGAGAEDRPFDHKYSNFQRFLRQTMQEIDQADSTANDSPERKAALKGLRRRRNSVVLFGHARDVLIADALKRWRRVHVAKHAVEHNSNKRIYDADFHAGCALDLQS